MPSKDSKDFGPTPRAKGFKLPSPENLATTKRDALLKLVAAQGNFPPRAARWLAPAELRHLLREDFPFESHSIYAVPNPRQIKSLDDLLNLAADRRVAYTQYLRDRKVESLPASRPRHAT